MGCTLLVVAQPPPEQPPGSKEGTLGCPRDRAGLTCCEQGPSAGGATVPLCCNTCPGPWPPHHVSRTGQRSVPPGAWCSLSLLRWPWQGGEPGMCHAGEMPGRRQQAQRPCRSCALLPVCPSPFVSGIFNWQCSQLPLLSLVRWNFPGSSMPLMSSLMSRPLQAGRASRAVAETAPGCKSGSVLGALPRMPTLLPGVPILLPRPLGAGSTRPCCAMPRARVCHQPDP